MQEIDNCRRLLPNFDQDPRKIIKRDP